MVKELRWGVSSSSLNSSEWQLHHIPHTSMIVSREQKSCQCRVLSHKWPAFPRCKFRMLQKCRQQSLFWYRKLQRKRFHCETYLPGRLEHVLLFWIFSLCNLHCLCWQFFLRGTISDFQLEERGKHKRLASKWIKKAGLLLNWHAHACDYVSLDASTWKSVLPQMRNRFIFKSGLRLWESMLSILYHKTLRDAMDLIRERSLKSF